VRTLTQTELEAMFDSEFPYLAKAYKTKDVKEYIYLYFLYIDSQILFGNLKETCLGFELTKPVSGFEKVEG
jgi:hypothetical protein